MRPDYPTSLHAKPFSQVCARTPAGMSSAAADGREPALDRDRIEGKSKELEGEAQQSWGKAKDRAGDAWEDVKDKAEDVVDETEDRMDEVGERDAESSLSR